VGLSRHGGEVGYMPVPNLEPMKCRPPRTVSETTSFSWGDHRLLGASSETCAFYPHRTRLCFSGDFYNRTNSIGRFGAFRTDNETTICNSEHHVYCFYSLFLVLCRILGSTDVHSFCWALDGRTVECNSSTYVYFLVAFLSVISSHFLAHELYISFSSIGP
jgi:hypothetical protein